jgi:CheY-like chemotaxis protein
LLKIIKTNAQMSEKKFPNIVIAEDVEPNYLYLKAVLTKLDAHVFWARNGIEVLEICEREKNIDLVLMDLQMPDMNGYEATAVLKQTYPNLPVIAQTAFAMSDDRDKAINAGCDDYLAKPIKSNDLLLMTMKYLNR